MKYGLSYTLITRTTGFLSRTVFHFRKTEVDYMCDYVSKQTDLRVLDYGCNTGYLLNRIEKKSENNKLELCGADINKYALEYARKKYKQCKFYKVSDKFIKEEKFDIIISSHVIEHTKNYKELVKSMIKMLKPNGKIIIVIPQERFRGDATLFQWAYNILRFRWENPHVVKISHDDLQNVYVDNNIKVIDEIYTNYFPPFKSKKKCYDSWSLVLIGQLQE